MASSKQANLEMPVWPAQLGVQQGEPPKWVNHPMYFFAGRILERKEGEDKERDDDEIKGENGKTWDD